MAVSNTTVRNGPYYPNGSTTTFPFTFRAVDDDDVQVVRIDASGGVVPVSSASYTVYHSATGGGVVFDIPPVPGAPLYVQLSPDFRQQINLENEGAFLPEVITEGLDRAALRALYLRDQIGRSFQVPPGGSFDGLFPVVLPGGVPGFASGTGNDPALRTDLASPLGGSKLAAYILESIAAQPRVLSEKISERVSLWDALTPAMRADVKNGNASVNCSPAWNAIANYASGGENAGNATGGMDLIVNPGRYLFTDPIKNTYRVDAGIVDDGDLRRMNVRGAGSANTFFFYGGDPSKPFYTVAGNNNGDGRDLYHVISGIRFRRNFGGRGQGTGVKLLNIANIHWHDVHVDGWNVGIDAQGVLGWSSFLLYILGNNAGLSAALGAGFTRPNAWQFVGGAISGNGVTGATFVDASNVGFLGTRLEANGAGEYGNEPNKVNQFVILMSGAPAEGGSWLSLDNVYAENNNVETEVSLSTASINSGVVGIRNCTFQRISNSRNPNRHLDFYAGGAGRIHVHLDTVAFREIGGYNPAATQNLNHRPWRNQTFNTRVTVTNVLYENMARQPETNKVPAVGDGYSQLLARGSVSAAGAMLDDSDWNCTVSRIAAGQYRVAYRIKPRSARVVPHVTLENNFGRGSYANQSVNSVDILTADSGGTQADAAFSFSVYGLPG